MAAPRPAGNRILPPTQSDLTSPSAKPYFLWWADCTVEQFRNHISDPDPSVKAYWLGALLREANSRDVWLFTTPTQIRELWPHLLRHLGRARAMWAWLLDLDGTWPPAEARRA